jgi:hypothetical protein
MKKNVLVLFIMAILSAAAFGQDVKGNFEDLTLTLIAAKSEVLPLVPIDFKVAVTNNSRTPIKVDGRLSFSTSSVGMEIKKPNGKTVTPNGLSHVRARSIFFPKDLAAGESMESSEVFDFKTQTYFGTPGRYQVRVSYKNGGGQKIFSDWIEVTLIEPLGTEKAAYDFLYKKMQKTHFPFTYWSTEELEDFVLKYAGTGYSNYARYTLGEHYFDHERDKAEEQFRAITDSTFVYAEQVNAKLKKLENQKKQ